MKIFGLGSSDVLLEMGTGGGAGVACNPGDYIIPTSAGVTSGNYVLSSGALPDPYAGKGTPLTTLSTPATQEAIWYGVPLQACSGASARRSAWKSSRAGTLRLIQPNLESSTVHPGPRRAAQAQELQATTPDTFRKEARMAYTAPVTAYPSEANVFIRDHAASGKLIIDFARIPAISLSIAT